MWSMPQNVFQNIVIRMFSDFDILIIAKICQEWRHVAKIEIYRRFGDYIFRTSVNYVRRFEQNSVGECEEPVSIFESFGAALFIRILNPLTANTDVVRGNDRKKIIKCIRNTIRKICIGCGQPEKRGCTIYKHRSSECPCSGYICDECMVIPDHCYCCVAFCRSQHKINFICPNEYVCVKCHTEIVCFECPDSKHGCITGIRICWKCAGLKTIQMFHEGAVVVCIKCYSHYECDKCCTIPDGAIMMRSCEGDSIICSECM